MRMAEVRNRVRTGESADPYVRYPAGIDLPGFLRAVRNHAAGFLAALTADIEIGWDAPLLRAGAVLVDLPGVGVANDAFQNVTKDWIRKSDAVLLVADRCGLSQACADLLRRANVFDRLVAETIAPKLESIEIVVAVVKVDLLAHEERAYARSIGGPLTRPWLDDFDRCCARTIDLLRAQLAQELRLAVRRQAVPASSEDSIVLRILDRVRVRPVAPIEYRRFHSGDPDEVARISRAEDSRIPMLIETIKALARRHCVDISEVIYDALSTVARSSRLPAALARNASQLARALGPGTRAARRPSARATKWVQAIMVREVEHARGSNGR